MEPQKNTYTLIFCTFKSHLIHKILLFNPMNNDVTFQISSKDLIDCLIEVLDHLCLHVSLNYEPSGHQQQDDKEPSSVAGGASSIRSLSATQVSSKLCQRKSSCKLVLLRKEILFPTAGAPLVPCPIQTRHSHQRGQTGDGGHSFACLFTRSTKDNPGHSRQTRLSQV